MQNQSYNQLTNNIPSPAVSSQPNLMANYTDIITQLENSIRTDAQRLRFLVQRGVLNQSQGQYFMSQLAGKANEISLCKNAIPAVNVSNSQIPSAQPIPAENPMDLFKQENPGFFEQGSRVDVLNYIKDLDMDKDEISKIAKMVENLENSAIDGYLKKSAHDKSLNDENLVAKSRLTANAQNAGNDRNFERIFTRADIGRMSGDEFAKNEKLIMEQIKHGLVK